MLCWSNTLVSLFKKHQMQADSIHHRHLRSLFNTRHSFPHQTPQNQNTCLLLLFGTIHTPNIRLFNIGTALVDMYAKCGCTDEALRVFENLQVKNVYTWKAIINGLAVHADALGALNIFSCMLKSGIQPNEVTFVGVLAACSHGGFVEEGKRLFESMKHAYHLKPEMDHYGCMVDMLGRAGYLEDAKKIIDSMPMKPNPGVLGALFGAFMVYKAFEMGEHIGNLLVNQQPNHSGNSALLANLYKMCQNWEATAQVRKLTKGLRVEKSKRLQDIV